MNNEKGVAILEFMVIFPILLAAIFAVLTIARHLRYTQVAATLSREAAVLTYRECATERDLRLELCLNEVRDELLAISEGIAPNTEIIVSVFVKDPVTELITVAEKSSPVGAGQVSRYQISGESITGISDETFLNNRTIVIGEVYIPFLFPLLNMPGFGGFAPDFVYNQVVI